MTPDTWSREELCCAAMKVFERLPQMDVYTAWVSGSLVEGFGNPSSDIDIFVAMRQLQPVDVPFSRRASDHSILALVESDVRYDLEFWALPDIDRLIGKLDVLPIDDPQHNNLHFLSYWESEFIHRLLVGIPLMHSDLFEALKQRFEMGRFARFLMDTAVRRTDDAFDDTVGMVRAGQLESAAMRARDAVGFSVDAWLHAHGNTNDKTKFRLQKLQRMVSEGVGAASDVRQTYWSFERAIPENNSGVEDYVKNALRFSSQLVDEATNKIRGEQHDSLASLPAA